MGSLKRVRKLWNRLGGCNGETCEAIGGRPEKSCSWFG